MKKRGRPLPAGAICPSCREFPLALDGIRSVYRYASPLKEALGRFKYVGARVAGDADSYRYLAESIRMHPDQDTLKQMMQDAGLERVEYFNLSAGVVALHRGYKF